MRASPTLLLAFTALPRVSPFSLLPQHTTSKFQGSENLNLVLSATKKVFIDGEAGTTGLQVRERLSGRDDLEIISPPSDLRKDSETRKKFINEADAVILCESKENVKRETIYFVSSFQFSVILSVFTQPALSSSHSQLNIFQASQMQPLSKQHLGLSPIMIEQCSLMHPLPFVLMKSGHMDFLVSCLQ